MEFMKFRKIYHETEVKPRLDFAQRLAQKLRESNLGEVDEGSLGDDSARWVQIKNKRTILSIDFDMKGEKIESIGLFKEILQVVDQKKIYGFDKKD